MCIRDSYCDLIVGSVLDGIQEEIGVSGGDIGASEQLVEELPAAVAAPEAPAAEAAAPVAPDTEAPAAAEAAPATDDSAKS